MCAFDETPRFLATYQNWDQYAITGLKIEWMPLYNVSAPGVGNIVGTLHKVDDLDDYSTINAMTENQIMSAPGFQNLDPRRSWKKFISAKAISKQQNVPW